MIHRQDFKFTSYLTVVSTTRKVVETQVLRGTEESFPGVSESFEG